MRKRRILPSAAPRNNTPCGATGVIGFRFGCENSGLVETVVVVEFVGSAPVGGKRGIGDHRIELSVAELVGLERVAVTDVEIVVSDTVQQHVHSAEVEGGRVFLLTEDFVGFAAPGRAKQ